MARGRDAVDVALTTTFGKPNLSKFTVWTDEVSEAAPPTPGDGHPESRDGLLLIAIVRAGEAGRSGSALSTKRGRDIMIL
jgi:hypothetical protein